MSGSAWDFPSAPTSLSGDDLSISTGSTLFAALTDSQLAPVVLSRGEVEYILGGPHSGSPRVPQIVCRRDYLADSESSLGGTTVRKFSGMEFRLPSASSSLFSSNSNPFSRAVSAVHPASRMQFVSVDDLNSGRETRTTFMVRRLPRYISVDQFNYLLQSTGILKDAADLIYVPVFTGKAYANRGYAFVNFKSPHLGALFVTIIRHSPETDLSKQLGRCDIVYAHLQSKEDMIANLARVREGPFWNQPTLPPGLLIF
jgi:hypothetical protein